MIVCEPLIETTIRADRLFSAQRRITKPRQTSTAESSLTEALKEGSRAKAVADVRSQLRAAASNEVGNRSVASRGTLRLRALQIAGPVGVADPVPLATHTERQPQPVVEKRKLILPKHGKRSLSISCVVEGVE